MKTVCVSGGFDPIHIGHVRMIEDAWAKTAAEVVVILNSDDWLMRKKGYVFMPWEQRASIIQSMRRVNTVVAVDDKDGTVCEALNRIKPTYFANGGDRKPDNTPELSLCDDLGIQPIFNIGGEKIESSSELVKNARTTMRPWGSYTILEETKEFKVKRITVLPKQQLSLQSHRYRNEHWIVVKGTAEVIAGDEVDTLHTDDTVWLPCDTKHRIGNSGDEIMEFIEVQTGSYFGEDDIKRYEDIYGRVK